MVAERAPRRMDPLPAVPAMSTIVVHVEGKGRGVVALRAVEKGELVERAPVVVVPSKDYDALSSTVLDGYVYDWQDGSLAVALGQGSIYNHSFQPNVLYVKSYDTLTIEYRALRDIAAGEELTINYNGIVDDESPMRFEVKG